MSGPTVNLLVKVATQGGVSAAGAIVTARLSAVDFYAVGTPHVVIQPIAQQATADATGLATLALFPNALGTENTFYSIEAWTSDLATLIFRTTCVLPDLETDLADIWGTVPAPTQFDPPLGPPTVVAVTQGGTGANTALGARHNLGIDDPPEQTVWIPASAMVPSISPLSPPSVFAAVRNLAGGTEATIPQFVNCALAIGASMQFAVTFPDGWDLGTITFQPYWLVAPAGAITGTKAKFELSGVAMSSSALLNVNFGTAVGVEQVVSSPTGYTLYVIGESGEVTIGNTPVAGDLCFFKVQRVAASSSDITDPLTLLGIKIRYLSSVQDL